MELAARHPGKYELVGAADPVAARLDLLESACGHPAGFRRFASCQDLLAAGKFADVAIIGTQDSLHEEHAIAAMECGYDLLLEKPVATTPEGVRRVREAAQRLGRRVVVCHVLRHTPFYREVHRIVHSGRLGEIVSLHATEGVGPWHQAHSFVRGHWSSTEKSSPMIVAKCCHDLDIIVWLMADRCERISSFGSLRFFTESNAPVGAPEYCVQGCPQAGACHYDARHYLGIHRKWLGYVYDRADTASDGEALEWLASSPWGRCVYRCDNDAVDRQSVSMEFSRGGLATLTMTAFAEGRRLEIFGTLGVLRGVMDGPDGSGGFVEVQSHGGSFERIPIRHVAGGYDGHGGGDAGLVEALYDEIVTIPAAESAAAFETSLESHLLGFAAEKFRHQECGSAPGRGLTKGEAARGVA
jgi:predicted dehydrogenase